MYFDLPWFQLSLAIERPWWLLLLPLFIPPLILLSFRSLSALGPVRRILAIAIRIGVVSLIVLALAELQARQRSDDLTTIFLVDNSESIPQQSKDYVRSYVNQALQAKPAEDQAGVILFGTEPRIEIPPTPVPGRFTSAEVLIDPEHTDLASALKLALATFPEGSAKRIVLLSDGNENRGQALEQATAAADFDIQIDTVPINYRYDEEVLVEKVTVPPEVKEGETVNVNVVIRASAPTTGRLEIYRKSEGYSGQVTPTGEPVPIELRRGLNVLTLPQTIEGNSFYTYTARFIPDPDSGDRSRINNAADGFTIARGEGRVLLIEGPEQADPNSLNGPALRHDDLVAALQERQVKITRLVAPDLTGSGVVGGDVLPADLSELLPYDAVILANVPGDSFSRSQIADLERYVRDIGGGLIMLGGPNSFGAGGWKDTDVERALPVDMEIKALRVMGRSALVMIMHASEIPEGNYWQKVVAKQSLQTLSSYDYAGLLHWQGQEAWLFSLRPIGNSGASMIRAIERMTPGDMPDFEPSLRLAVNGLARLRDAMTKHIIIISDGDPTPPTNRVINLLKQNKITITTVLTAAHGNDPASTRLMQDLARQTKGRFYNVTNPKALPKIYQKEARIISRPLIYERADPWRPQVVLPTEPVVGLTDSLPPIRGLVLTQAKENGVVEIPLKSPQPLGQDTPLLAHWTYGLGRSVAFTSDAAGRWTADWTTWEDYAAFWEQIVRWSMRRVDPGNLQMTVRREEGDLRIVIDALDDEEEFLNFLTIRGNLNGPGMNQPIDLEQTAPGRYEALVPGVEQKGNYFVTLSYDDGQDNKGQVTSGVSVPYSDEYRELTSNPPLMETLASLTSGSVIDWRTDRDGRINVAATLNSLNPFRHDRTPPAALDDLWPLLLWGAALLFLLDVAVRRIAIDFAWLGGQFAKAYRQFRGSDQSAESDEYMAKLRGRKAEVEQELAQRARSATQFQAPPPLPTADDPIAGSEPIAVDDVLQGQATGAPSQQTTPPPPPPKPDPGSASDDADSYTNRLLQAKRKVWEDRQRDSDGNT